MSEVAALAEKKKIPYQRTMLRAGGQDGAAAQQAAAGARAVSIVGRNALHSHGNRDGGPHGPQSGIGYSRRVFEVSVDQSGRLHRWLWCEFLFEELGKVVPDRCCLLWLWEHC